MDGSAAADAQWLTTPASPGSGCEATSGKTGNRERTDTCAVLPYSRR